MSRGCKFDTDGDGNCPLHPEGCPVRLAGDVPAKETPESIISREARRIAEWMRKQEAEMAELGYELVHDDLGRYIIDVGSPTEIVLRFRKKT